MVGYVVPLLKRPHKRNPVKHYLCDAVTWTLLCSGERPLCGRVLVLKVKPMCGRVLVLKVANNLLGITNMLGYTKGV